MPLIRRRGGRGVPALVLDNPRDGAWWGLGGRLSLVLVPLCGEELVAVVDRVKTGRVPRVCLNDVGDLLDEPCSNLIVAEVAFSDSMASLSRALASERAAT